MIKTRLILGSTLDSMVRQENVPLKQRTNRRAGTSHVKSTRKSILGRGKEHTKAQRQEQG